MKTLYVTDLDGTLLGADAVVSPATSRLLTELTEAGALISVATARTPATVEPLLRDTLTGSDLVVMTGAALWNRLSRRYDDLRLLAAGDVSTVVDTMTTHSLHLFAYDVRPDGFIEVYHPAPSLTEAEERFVALRRNLQLKHFNLGAPLPEADYASTVLFFGMGPYERITALAEALRRTTGCYVSYYKDIYLDDVWLIEIFAGGVSKAEGIARLRRLTGAERVVTFGDNLNDIPMLRAADLGVAVGNALPETKAAASVVIGPNTADAVARFIADDFARQ
ncbi:MAG: HAD hydrolase family protein [Bacteroides sp.]|nr:HAD hydrolase family protein [Bacteroides sp.]MCM1096156.1 HAD hydrolase family protein [Terasakiella sp.]